MLAQQNSRTAICAGAIVALMAGALLFPRLDFPLLEPDESRYALIPLLMLQSGDWLVPQLQNKPYNDKPPLNYWLTAISYSIFGVHEWSARLVPALAGWLTILGTYAWGCQRFGWRSAFLSATVLTTMSGFAVMSRMLLLDSLLTLWITMALWTGQAALCGTRLRWSWWLCSASCTGLGILTKGPVAIALAVPGLALYRWIEPSSVRWRLKHCLIYITVALAIAAPWYAAIIQQNAKFADDFFWRHHLMRFIKPYHHLRPWWFYVPVLLAELLPWTVAVLYRFGKTSPATHFDDHRRGTFRLCALAAGWTFLFFSASACKLPTYLMPSLPFFALLIGHRIYKQQMIRTWVATSTVGTISLACVLWWGMPYYASQVATGPIAARWSKFAEAGSLPVIAYRDDWASASFYRTGRELPVFAHHEPDSLVAYIQQHGSAAILVREKPSGRVDELRKLLTPRFEVQEIAAHSQIAVVIVYAQDR